MNRKYNDSTMVMDQNETTLFENEAIKDRTLSVMNNGSTIDSTYVLPNQDFSHNDSDIRVQDPKNSSKDPLILPKIDERNRLMNSNTQVVQLLKDFEKNQKSILHNY